MSRRIVLDTNCLLQAISRRSRFYQASAAGLNMIPRIRQIRPLANFRLLVDFDEGRRVIYDVSEDIREIAAFVELKTLPGLFESARLDSSRTSVVWNDRIDLPSDTILEYGGEVPVS